MPEFTYTPLFISSLLTYFDTPQTSLTPAKYLSVKSNENNSSKLLADIEKDIKKKSPEYRCVITVDLAL